MSIMDNLETEEEKKMRVKSDREKLKQLAKTLK